MKYRQNVGSVNYIINPSSVTVVIYDKVSATRGVTYDILHRNKLDSPSGTALMLANSINEFLNNKMEYVYNRHELKQKRTDKEIGIHSIRGGTEVGKHSVMFYGDNESFEITHTVTNRSIFARGAIKAAIFLSRKKNGLYNMKDLIG